MSRYQRAVEIEDLIVTLAGSRRGLTIEEISTRYEVSRRTAERMRDAVAERFPLLECERCEGDRRKRWRIDGRALGGLVTLGSVDGALLEEGASVLAGAGRPDLAREIRRLARRIRLAGNGPLRG